MARITEVKEIPMDSLVVGKAQVRTRDLGKGIDELADSIARVGLLEPIAVSPGEKLGTYEIILGQRRYLAHVELKKETILAAIFDEKVAVSNLNCNRQAGFSRRKLLRESGSRGRRGAGC